MSSTRLLKRTDFSKSTLNWVFLVWYLVCGLVTLLFLFLFNRVLARVIASGIRLYTWHYYRVHVELQALQISPLAGRIFFKGARYYGRNETILIQDGHITWRYWIRKVQELDDAIHSKGQDRPLSRSSSEDAATQTEEVESSAETHEYDDLPCRVQIKVRGVQWFVYNRSPAYDAIVQSMAGSGGQGRHTSSDTNAAYAHSAQSEETSSSMSSSSGLGKQDRPEREKAVEHMLQDRDPVHPDPALTPANSNQPEQRQKVDDDEERLPSLLNILPVSLECNKAAVVMGNQSTHCVLVAKIQKVAGKFTARPSRPEDLYKQVIDFELVHPTIDFKHNRDYKDTSFQEGARLASEKGQTPSKERPWYETFGKLRTLWRTRDLVKDLMPHVRGSVDSLRPQGRQSSGPHDSAPKDPGAYGQSKWLGLTRYLDDEDDTIEQERWKSIEYAQMPNVVDCPSIFMSLYWDVPGRIQSGSATGRPPLLPYTEDINGGTPPDWGIELRVRGGKINYGPWADRQRTELQNAFFPALYNDATPGLPLSPGDARVSTELKVVIVVEEQITLLVPTREDSKDWKWKGRTSSSATADSTKKSKHRSKNKKGSNSAKGAGSRPFGWLDVRIAVDSTIRLAVDLVAKADGYRNQINADLKGVEISSSVNHAVLWRSSSQVISCDLSNPLRWNALRQWHIDIHDESLQLFMLRDHMFLMTDLVNDWTTGPLPEYHTFIPFVYTLDLQFRNFKLFLNANDSNIIDSPADTADNTFVVIWGNELLAKLKIPNQRFRPSRNSVTFDIEARDGGFQLLVPPWNTQSTFLQDRDVAALKDLKINGSYTYMTATATTLTDVLLLDIYGASPQIQLYGFLIRYLMNIKDNYFGDCIHFKTMEEHQRQVDTMDAANDGDLEAEQHKRPSNDLDVILTIKAENARALLPAHLYSAEEHVSLEILTIGADLRITNYYMDLAVSSSPLAISQSTRNSMFDTALDEDSKIQIFVDGLQVAGHRLFGLPPTEPTYVCNWDFDVGEISGECSVDFLRTGILAVRCFALSLDDEENALPQVKQNIIHDVTFLRARLRSVHIALRVEDVAFLLGTQTVEIGLNDLAGPLFSDRLHAKVPGLTIAIADDHGSTSGPHGSPTVSKTFAFLQTDIILNRITRGMKFIHNRQLQQNHVAMNDLRTNRVPWMTGNENGGTNLSSAHTRTRIRPPAMPFPPMPEPLHAVPQKRDSIASAINSQDSYSTKSSKSSFLMGRSRPHREDSGDSSAPLKESELTSLPLTTTPSKTSQAKSAKMKSNLYSQRNFNIDQSEQGSRSTKQRPSIKFSSPYKRPYFPLLAIVPDTRNVPTSPNTLRNDSVSSDDDILQELESNMPDEGAEKNSFLIELSRGLRILCSPEALILLTHLQDQLHVSDISSMLDDLQINTMRDVLTLDEKRKQGSRSFDIRLFAPHLGGALLSTAGASQAIDSQRERYDFAVNELSINFRTMTRVPDDIKEPIKDQFTVHLLIKHVDLSARESTSDGSTAQAVISFRLYHPMFWLFAGSKTTAELQIDSFEIISASRKVDYISSLVCQTALLSEDIARRFGDIAAKNRSRLRLYVLSLAQKGADETDPPFLSGASFVLRSATNHLRTSDSWRMISRLRHVQNNLSSENRDHLQEQCLHDWVYCPEDGPSRVASAFEQWRTWDLGHIESSLLVRRVYGASLSPQLPTPQGHNTLNLSVKVQSIRIVAEPGESQNEIMLERCLFGISIGHKSKVSSSMGHSLPSNTISAQCGKAAVRFNWSLCDLIENIIETARSTQLQSFAAQDSDRSPPASRKILWHIVASSDMSILNIDTPNLKAVTICKSLQTSIIRVQAEETRYRGSTSLVISAASTKSEVFSRTTLLSVYNLHEPHIFGSQDLRRRGEPEKPWKFVGSGLKISFHLMRTPLELAEVVDTFIQQEVAHLTQWLKTLPISKVPPPTLRQKEAPSSLPKAQVTLVLESFTISTMVLPSLFYEIQGPGLRTSIQSAIDEKSSLSVNLDLNEHSHTFKSGSEGDLSEVSKLAIPPIYTYLRFDPSPEHNIIEVRALVNQVVLDASSLHAILNAVNQPAIITLGKEIEQEISLIQTHVNGIFPRSEPQESAKVQSSIPFLFDADVVVAGLAIHAQTPETLALGKAAELEINFGRISLQGTNADSGRHNVLPMSEFQVELRSIRMDLMRHQDLDFEPCGDLAFDIMFKATSRTGQSGDLIRGIEIATRSLNVNLYTATASAVLAVLGHLQNTLTTIEVPNEVRDLQKLGRDRLRRQGILMSTSNEEQRDAAGPSSKAGAGAAYWLLIMDVQIAWKIGNELSISPEREAEDLFLSFQKLDLATKQNNVARLLIEDLQLQIVPASKNARSRSPNSALLPELIFNVAYKSTDKDRRLAFQAVGKSLDIQLTSQSILPANDLRRSIAAAAEDIRAATEKWKSSAPKPGLVKQSFFGSKRLASLLVHVDFAGAVVHIQGRHAIDPQSMALNLLRGGRAPQHGRHNKFSSDESKNSTTTLRAPGVALKVRYVNANPDAESLNVEMMVSASSNTLFPTVVPLIIEMTSSVQEIMAADGADASPEQKRQQQQQRRQSRMIQPKFLEDERLRNADPSALLGKCKLNVGLRICKQEFSLSCQPIARVAARARFEDIYLTLNTVHSDLHGKFFTLSAAFTGLHVSVQHVYSRDSTGSIEVESIVASCMSSRHVSAANGLSAILRISPTKVQINAKQLQDFLLFREIWVPEEFRQSSTYDARPPDVAEPQFFAMQRYHQIAATGAFHWNATIFIADLTVELDLGQSLGKSVFRISDFWISSRKASDWQQDLCLGFEKVSADATGRIGGLVELQNFRVRTSIRWPVSETSNDQTPLVQASTSFDHLRVKLGFDFQAFIVADISSLHFLMYNVREHLQDDVDRLVGVLEGDKVQIFCTSTSASQAFALYQAFQRLFEEKQKAYEASLADIEKFLRPKPAASPLTRSASSHKPSPARSESKSPLRLQTDVVVALKAVNLGAFPNTFLDTQILKLEALETSARFAVVIDGSRIHSTLSMTLGQLRVALSGVNRIKAPKTLGDIAIEDVVASATGSQGGTILKVPKLIATMQTWQSFGSTHIDYIFKSSFQGKVDVGWNYSRISYIRGMHANHTRTLAQRLGKPLPESAVKITGLETDQKEGEAANGGRDKDAKITAVVNVPQSKYDYTALQPAVIETPQLRDMGEATPPLEWIGLQRDRLPTLTHQIVIVTLLEVAKEVDDAYFRILGSS